MGGRVCVCVCVSRRAPRRTKTYQIDVSEVSQSDGNEMGTKQSRAETGIREGDDRLAVPCRPTLNARPVQDHRSRGRRRKRLVGDRWRWRCCNSEDVVMGR